MRPTVSFATLDQSVDFHNILTPEELAARLKVPKSWIFEKTRSRCLDPIPHYRIGRYVRFNWTRIVEWLATTEEGDAKRPSLS